MGKHYGVFDVETQIGSIVMIFIIELIFPCDFMEEFSLYWQSERSAVDSFLTHFCSHGRTSRNPCNICSDACSVNVCTMEILTCGGTTDEFKIVHKPVPIDFGAEPDASLGLGTEGEDESAITLILIRIGCGVEGVGAIGFLAVAGLKVESEIIGVIPGVEVCVAALEIGVDSGPV